MTPVRVGVKLVLEPIAPVPPEPPQAPSRKPVTPASANSGPIRPSCRRVVRRPDITLVPRVLAFHIRFAYDSIKAVSLNPSFLLTASIGAFSRSLLVKMRVMPSAAARRDDSTFASVASPRLLRSRRGAAI